MEDPVATKTQKQAKPESQSASKRVELVVDAREAAQVAVTGDFTGWSPEGVPLARGEQGEWRATLELAPGEYQYRLKIDGEWKDHPTAQKRVPNPFGSENCVLLVGRG